MVIIRISYGYPMVRGPLVSAFARARDVLGAWLGCGWDVIGLRSGWSRAAISYGARMVREWCANGARVGEEFGRFRQKMKISEKK